MSPEPTSRRAAVLGSPITHSLSPALHNAAYTALGLPGWHYDAHEVDERALPGFVDSLGPEWAGLSLTMPLKRVALDVADHVAPAAAAIGAANTLVFGPDGRTVHNTDVTGIVAALRRARDAGVPGPDGAVAAEADRPAAGSGAFAVEPDGPAAGSGDLATGSGDLATGSGTGRDSSAGSRGRAVNRAVVLGAGGTAQAAIAALAELGMPEVAVLVRDAGRTTELRETARRLGTDPQIRAVLTDPLEAARALDGADVVISTLPAGAADELAGARWRPGTTLLDAVYAPWPTAVAAGAAAGGATIVSGLEMLLQQAIAQVELMTGRPGPEQAMREALDAAVLARSA
ncbi:shikimate dehydrogenase [Pseudonocardia sediminis]|uniref:Shikimate dehydrogenase n=1 Tax=Pseudonocardia sediminis TaxID=1397368 RepID=A0A4Q7V0H3_PSEST|nr:shikimate dehydrogenase [Pseudonocardia sediminis]RZT86073.1 shikimate dehydrogenase [Pseudonocardia sediminis]